MFRFKSSKPTDYRTERYIRYGIRKFTVGVASVAIAAGLLFLGRGVVLADGVDMPSTEVATTVVADSGGLSDTATVSNSPAEKTAEALPVEEVKEQPVDEVVLSEETNPDTDKPLETPPTNPTSHVADKSMEVESSKPVLVKDGLMAKISTLQARLVGLNREKVSATVLAEAEALLATAQSLLANEGASQADIDAATSSLEMMLAKLVVQEAATSIEKTVEVPAEVENEVSPDLKAEDKPVVPAKETISAPEVTHVVVPEVEKVSESLAPRVSLPAEAQPATPETPAPVEEKKQELKTLHTDLSRYLPKLETVASHEALVTEAKAVLASVTDSLSNTSITAAELENRIQEAARLRLRLTAVVTGLTSGARDPRNGKSLGKPGSDFRADDAADVETEMESAEYPRLDKAPLSADDQHNHYKKFQDPNTKLNKNLDELNKQLFFIDWTDPTATITGLGDKITTTNSRGQTFEGYELKVGSTWTKEITDGYVVTVRVKELKNILGEENGIKIQPGSENYNKLKNAGVNVDDPNYRYNSKMMVYKENYNGFSAISNSGLTSPGLTAVTGEIAPKGWYDQDFGDHTNSGITFELSATYKGKSVKPAFFAVSAEEAGDTEVEIYKTNGKGWELLTEIMCENTTRSFEARDDVWLGSDDGVKGIYSFAGYTGEELESRTKKLLDAVLHKKDGNITTETITEYYGHVDGLGTRTFGPVSNHLIKDKNETADGDYAAKSTPIIVTRGATEVTAYLISNGAQAFTFGVMALDQGDAPSSYGEALHLISKGRDGSVRHPYLGSKEADIDELDLSKPRTVWRHDGITGEPDEGPDQLVGDRIKANDNYTLHKANDGTYELEVIANRNGNAKSYVKGWVDFNANGKFDEDEGSNMADVTTDGYVKLTFTNKYQNVSTDFTKLGMRVRTALNSTDIEYPTGYAMSGEVEDFKIQQALPPRGEKKTSIDEQGKKQTSTVAFNAYGKIEYDSKTDNAIDTDVPPVMVKMDGSVVKADELDGDGYYSVAGEGKYKVTGEGKDVTVEFIPEANFIGVAKGIMIRRTDKNKTDTGWGKIDGRTIVWGSGTNRDEFTTITANNTMDGLFIPIVTPKAIKGESATNKDLQNTKQEKTLVFKNADDTAILPTGIKQVYSLKDAGDDGKVVVYKDAEKTEKAGEYSLDAASGKVTFTPDAKFTGIAPAATVILTVTPENMDASLDEATKQALTKTAEATFTPEVVGAVPEGKNATTKDIQGQPRTAKILLDTKEETDDTATVNFNKGGVKLNDTDPEKFVELDPDTLIMLDGDQAVASLDAKAGDKVVGRYQLDPVEKTITFTPDKDYDGKTPVTPATLRILDVNGGEARATYTPEVIGVKPTAELKASKDIQGAVQIGKPDFKAGSTEIAGAIKEVPLDDTVAAVLVDDKGTPLPLNDKGEYVVAKVGTYKVAADGTVTFTPEKTYVGKPAGVLVRRVDKNGTPADGLYTPEVVAVMPTATPAETEDVQGAVQTGKPDFKAGSVEIDGTTKEVPLDDTVAAVLVDKEGKALPLNDKGEYAVEKVGTYKVSPDGTVTFTPEKTYVGKPAGVLVRRVDKNGTPVDGLYTPEVIGVKPTAEPKASKDIQGAVQIGKPDFKAGSVEIDGTTKEVPLDDTVAAVLVDKEGKPLPPNDKGEYVVAKVGTYKVAADGTVTFTPEKIYVGKPDGVLVRRVDKNGTPADGLYTPEVVAVTPTAEPKSTKYIQGAVQTGKPDFKAGSVEIDGTTKEVPLDDTVAAVLVDNAGKPLPLNDKGEYVVETVGTYKVAADGTVTFTPEKTYVGKPDGVLVRRVDKNGTPVDGLYTPEVVAVMPTATPAETEDVQGQPQTAKIVLDEVEETDNKVTVNFNKGTIADLKDEDGNPKSVALNGATLTLLDGDKEVTELDAKAGDKVIGKFTLDKSKAEVVFTPNNDYDGSTPVTPVTLRIADENGTTITTTYTPKVTPVTITPNDDTSAKVQGMTQSGKPTFAFSSSKITPTGYKLVDLADKTAKDKVVIPGKGTYTVDDKGSITFIPEPDFIGEAPITVEMTDSLGHPHIAIYTPTKSEVELTSKDADSKDIQGTPQSGQPTFTQPKDTEVYVTDDKKLANFTSYKLIDPTDDKKERTTDKVVIDKVGTYTIDEKGMITFTPDKGYKSDTPTSISVRTTLTITNALDKTTTLTKDAVYTPTVVPVTPIAEPKSTKDIQGTVQTGKPDFKAGSVEIDGTTKEVPLDDTVAAVLVDNAGKPLPLNDKGEYVVETVGTYKVAADGTVTFTPEKIYVGKPAGVLVRRVDKNGTPVDGLYTPEVVAVEITKKDKETVGHQGAKQEGSPTFTVQEIEGYAVSAKTYTLKGADKDGKVVIPNEGTYTIHPTSGIVTFIPIASYISPEGKTATGVTVVQKASFIKTGGTSEPQTSSIIETEARYTPTVKPVSAAGEYAPTSKTQGTTHTGIPSLTPPLTGKDSKVSHPRFTFADSSVDAKVIETVGTYTLNPNTGEVVFTPIAKFVGTPVGIEVKAVYTLTAADGSTTEIATAPIRYVPTVTPVRAAGKSTSTRKPQYETHDVPVALLEFSVTDTTNLVKDKAGKPIATYAFVGGVTSFTEPGQGTYTIDPSTGAISFVPVDDFTGTAKEVTVVASYTLASQDGKTKEIITATATYTPTVTPVHTSFVDEDEKAIIPNEKGRTDKKTLQDYRYVKTVKDKDGNVIHHYEQVKTRFVDTSGNSLVDEEKGSKSAKNLQNYRLVDSKKLPNGDTEHIYQLITTSFVDEGNHPISNQPVVPGKQPAKDIPNYSFVKTVVDPETNNVTHIYKKVETPRPEVQKGNIVVRYENEVGTIIHDPATILTNVPVGTKYNTTGYRLPMITGKDGKEYELVSSATCGAETGTVEGNTTAITYVYREKVEVVDKITTTYTTEDGRLLPNTTVEEGQKSKKDFDGYTFIRTEKDDKGNLRHIYKKVETPRPEVQKGNIVVRYENEAGTIIHDPATVLTNVPVGTKYDTTGHRLQTLTGKDGKEYELVPSATRGAETGTVEGNTTTITYVYREKVEVVDKITTTYITEDGRLLPNTEVEEGQKDKKDFEGYSFIRTEKDNKGNLRHIYKKVETPTPDVEKGSIVVRYENEAGTIIHDPATVLTNVPVGTKYDTTGYRLLMITGKDGKEYELVPSATRGAETGTVEGNTTTITYVYREKVEVVDKITTTYTTEDGRLLPNTTVEEGQKSKKDFDGYTFVRTEKDDKGNLRHIYKKVETPVITVTTSFVDETNRPIKDAVSGKQDKVLIDGYEFVETTSDKDGNIVHHYKKVQTPSQTIVTQFVDESGRSIASEEQGEQPIKKITNYDFIRTVVDSKGTTRHIYRKRVIPSVVKPDPKPTLHKKVTTSYVDKEGHELLIRKDGRRLSETIPGYILVGQFEDENGNLVYIYDRSKEMPTPTKQVAPNNRIMVSRVDSTTTESSLPNTGSRESIVLSTLGIISLLSTLGAVILKKKEEQ